MHAFSATSFFYLTWIKFEFTIIGVPSINSDDRYTAIENQGILDADEIIHMATNILATLQKSSWIPFRGWHTTRYRSILMASIVSTEALAIVFSMKGTSLPEKKRISLLQIQYSPFIYFVAY